jgi:hypothetical protein
MDRLNRLLTLTVALIVVGSSLSAHLKALAQGESKYPPKFSDPDSPDTRGKYSPKIKGASVESVVYGYANVAHGTYVQSSRPPCQGTDSWGNHNWSSCGLVVAHLPVNATVDNVQAYAREVGQAGYSVCYSPAQDCAIGWSTFVDNYQVNNTGSEILVQWTFSNWSHNRDRQAMIAVSYH